MTFAREDYFWIVKIICHNQDQELLLQLLENAGSLGHYELLWEKDNQAFALTEQVSVMDVFFPLDKNQSDLETILLLCASQFEKRHFQYEISRLGSDEYQQAFEKNFATFYITTTMKIIPPWEVKDQALDVTDYRNAPEHPLVISPGMAFGTGQHETTHLCLEWLEQTFTQANQKLSILDIGCGSGVLSIFSAFFGHQVYGLDVSSLAVANSLDNLAFNQRYLPGLGALQAEFAEGDFEHGWLKERSYDMVIANITAAVLGQNIDQLSNVSAPRGIFSGITLKTAREFLPLLKKYGYEIIEQRERNEWLLLYWQRTG